MDGTGVPVAAAETAGRKGKSGAEARTREVKLGCVFTQSRRDEQGRPLRDEDSTSYTGAIEDAAAFGRRLWGEAWRRGWSRARKQVVLGDGAAWIWNLSHEYFPGAIEIVDLYHAREHLWELASKLFPQQQKRLRGWGVAHAEKARRGAHRATRHCAARDRNRRPGVGASAGAGGGLLPAQRGGGWRYHEFRRQGLFVGSGVIEAGMPYRDPRAG